MGRVGPARRRGLPGSHCTIWARPSNGSGSSHEIGLRLGSSDFFFIIFLFSFFTNIYFFFKIYRYIPRPSRCRAAEVFLQKFSRKICAEAPGGPVARQWGGRPPRPPDSGAAGPRPPGSGATASPGPIYKVVVVEHRPSHLGRNDGGTTQLRIFSPTARGGPSLAPSWYPEARSSELQGRRSAGRLSGQRKPRAR